MEGNLVLSRQEGERIYLGNDIVIEVYRVRGKRVRLAINAPKTLTILRGELAGELSQPSVGEREVA